MATNVPILPLVAAAAPAVAGGIASLIGGERRNRAEREAAREQMAFQERMSNTAYARATSDMRMSGINPMLAYAQGGASSPGGAKPDVQDVVSPAVSSASHAGRLGEEIRMLRSQRALVDQERLVKVQEAANIHTDTYTKGLTHDMLKAQTAAELLHGSVLSESISSAKQTRALQALDFPGARNQAAMEGTDFGRVMPYADRLMSSFGRLIPSLFLAPRMGRFGSSARQVPTMRPFGGNRPVEVRSLSGKFRRRWSDPKGGS